MTIRRALHLALPNPGYYGWWVVAACLLCACLSAPGQSYALALYIEPVAEALGTSRIEVATIYAWATLTAALLLPLAGRIADRTPSRFYLSSVVGLLGLSLFLLSSVGSWPLLAVAFFALRLLGQGATGLGVLTAVLRWFEAYRGRAIAIAVTGYAVGEFVMPSVIVRLQAELGWRGSLVALALAYLIVLAPLIYLVMRTPSSRDGGPVLHERPRARAVSTSAARAIRMPRFWLLVSVVSVTPFVLTALLINHVALFATIGWSAMDVARALQGYAVAGVVATYLTGAVLDRYPAKLGVLCAMVLLALGLLVPLGVHSPSLGVPLYGVLLGAASGATNATNGVIWPEQFGVGSVGAIKGIVSTVRNGVTAAAAPLGAWMVEQGGGFSGVLVAGGVLAGITACVALFLPARRSWAAPDSGEDSVDSDQDQDRRPAT